MYFHLFLRMFVYFFTYFRVFLHISMIFRYFHEFSCMFKYFRVFLCVLHALLFVFRVFLCVFRAFLWVFVRFYAFSCVFRAHGMPTTTLTNLPDPSLNAPRNKISRAGKPLTSINLLAGLGLLPVIGVLIWNCFNFIVSCACVCCIVFSLFAHSQNYCHTLKRIKILKNARKEHSHAKKRTKTHENT